MALANNRSQFNSDKMGILLSSICLFHCLIVPFTLIFLPVSLASFLANEAIHITVVILSTPIAFQAMRHGLSIHGSRKPIKFSITGLLLLWASIFVHEPHWLEPSLVAIGASLCAYAHLMNYKLVKGCDENCCN